MTGEDALVHGDAMGYRSPGELLVIDRDGRNEESLLDERVAAVRPCWTPDDRLLAAALPGASNSIAAFVLVSTSGEGRVRTIAANEATVGLAGCSWQPLR